MKFWPGVLLLTLSLMVHQCGWAQYTEEEGGVESKNGYLRYLGFGVGATYQVMNDAAISPITYSKIVGVTPMLNYMKVNPNVYTELSLRASSVNLTHNTNKLMQPKVKTQRALLDYRFMLKVPYETRMNTTDIRAGGILSAMFGYKHAPHLLDAEKVYEYAASLGLGARITKQMVMREKTVFLSWDVALPVVANVSRPSYLNRRELSDPENKEMGDFFANSATGTFGKFFRLNSRVALMRRMENGNAITLSYQWDYSKIKTINKAFFAEHIVSLAFMFNH